MSFAAPVLFMLDAGNDRELLPKNLFPCEQALSLMDNTFEWQSTPSLAKETSGPH
jgi:hypothetical protein